MTDDIKELLKFRVIADKDTVEKICRYAVSTVENAQHEGQEARMQWAINEVKKKNPKEEKQ